ncbi:MAG: hypothetical protein HFF17_07070 [Oscillospiraceae bacterium]|nr:hypothetical protein [Oscillospiraceae bacterium]
MEEASTFGSEMSRCIDAVLVAGVDYGIIPRCTKPSLLKPGAEKIMNYLGLIDYNGAENGEEAGAGGCCSECGLSVRTVYTGCGGHEHRA